MRRPEGAAGGAKRRPLFFRAAAPAFRRPCRRARRGLRCPKVV